MRREETSLDVEVIPAAPGQQPILANLLDLYAQDFREFVEVEFDPDGRFNYASLPLYWTEPTRHPFLITIEGAPAGFALVKQGSEISGDMTAWDMAEFFVLRAHRRRGIGTRFAHQVWQRFPGRWEVRLMESNRPALEFWQEAIQEFTGEPIRPARLEKDGKWWQIFSFVSK